MHELRQAFQESREATDKVDAYDALVRARDYFERLTVTRVIDLRTLGNGNEVDDLYEELTRAVDRASESDVCTAVRYGNRTLAVIIPAGIIKEP